MREGAGQLKRPPAVDSPCIRLCRLDPATGLCEGCGRTAGEIGGWLALAPEERRRIMRELPARLRRGRPAAADVTR